MNRCISVCTAPVSFLFLFLCVLFGVSACADKSAIRDKERERYDALESELISAQEAEERRQRSEFRVTQQLQKLEAERTTDALARIQTQSQTAATNGDEVSSSASITDPIVHSATGSVFTEYSGDQSASDVAETWTLQKYPSPVDGSLICAVVSNPALVSNGTLETRVSVIIGKEAVYLRTDTSFDTTAPEIGYRIDAGIPIAFDHFLNELTAVVDNDYDRLLHAILSGSNLRATFAYSPQLSAAETQVIDFSLDSIARPLSDLTGCSADAKEKDNPDGDKDESKGG